MKDYVLDNVLAVYSIVRFPGHNLVTDADVREVMKNETLRSVTQAEFNDYHSRNFRNTLPERKEAAFGNTCAGPAEQGGFTGTPYLDTDGDLKVAETWARGSDGDQWEGDWGFVFYQLR